MAKKNILSYQRMAEDVMRAYQCHEYLTEKDMSLFSKLASEKGHTKDSAIRDFKFLVYFAQYLKCNRMFTDLKRTKKHII